MSIVSHQNNFATNLTSNQIAGVTTTPLNSIPSVAAPFYLALDATNTNSAYEVIYVTSKTATNVNHAATTYAHTTAEEVRMIVPAAELDVFTTTTGTETLTNKTLTSPKVGTSIADTSGNEIIKTPATASAVNEVTITNAATGTAPLLSATGDDTNIGLQMTGKGTGRVYPQMASAKVTCSGTTNTTTSADITGATVTFTPNVACYALITMVADLSSSVAGDIATVDLKVDGSAQTPQCIFTAPSSGYRATVAQTYLITLTAASHTIKMTLNRASGTGTVTAQISQTGFTYLLLSQ